MPIPNLDNESPINQYVSSSGQTEFVFSFYIFATSDIKVYVNDVLKTITTDYVVRKSDGGVIGSSDLPMDGGKIIFNVGQVAGAKISINRDIPINRYTQFVTGGDFKADAFNTELTRILAIQQQLNRDISRSFRLAPSDAEGGSLQLPTNRASNILAFDANGNLILTKLADIDKANVSPFIATLLDDVSASVARGTLDAQQLNANLTTLAGLAGVANLTALAGLTGASNKLPYFTGAGAMAVRDLLATTTTQGIAFLSNPITISNNATDANNDIDFSAGNAPLDDGSGQVLLSSTLVKRLDATWSAGTNQGGLFSGTKANSTWYYLFAITNGTINDAGFDISPTGANIPSGYKGSYRGAVLNDGSGNIRAFKKIQNRFYLGSITDASPSPSSSVYSTYTLSVPKLNNIVAMVKSTIDYTGTGVTTLGVNYRFTSTSIAIESYFTATSGYTGVSAIEQLPTNNLGQIDVSFIYTAPATNFRIVTNGYIDYNIKN